MTHPKTYLDILFFLGYYSLCLVRLCSDHVQDMSRALLTNAMVVSLTAHIIEIQILQML